MTFPIAFQRGAFSYTAFQTSSISPVQDGRSGYWRLFYTELQEESLKKDHEAKVKQAVKDQVVAMFAPKTVDKKVTKKRVVEVKPFVPELELPKLKPIFRQESSLPESQVMDHFWLMSGQVQQWYLEFQPILTVAIKNRVRIIQQSANDADFRIRLLLLAA